MFTSAGVFWSSSLQQTLLSFHFRPQPMLVFLAGPRAYGRAASGGGVAFGCRVAGAASLALQRLRWGLVRSWHRVPTVVVGFAARGKHQR